MKKVVIFLCIFFISCGAHNSKELGTDSNRDAEIALTNKISPLKNSNEKVKGQIYVIKGKGRTQKTAIVDAYKKAMIEHFKKNDREYKDNERLIKDFVKKIGKNMLLAIIDLQKT